MMSHRAGGYHNPTFHICGTSATLLPLVVRVKKCYSTQAEYDSYLEEC